jgi:hypothetical protein
MATFDMLAAGRKTNHKGHWMDARIIRARPPTPLNVYPFRPVNPD